MSNLKLEAPIAKELSCDVVVVGAGPGGLIAAVTAAKEGMDVILVERYGCAGGMLTVGEVRNVRCFNNGEGQWICGDTVREFLQLLDENGGGFCGALRFPKSVMRRLREKRDLVNHVDILGNQIQIFLKDGVFKI